jgi:hypothetical protein
MVKRSEKISIVLNLILVLLLLLAVTLGRRQLEGTHQTEIEQIKMDFSRAIEGDREAQERLGVIGEEIGKIVTDLKLETERAGELAERNRRHRESAERLGGLIASGKSELDELIELIQEYFDQNWSD